MCIIEGRADMCISKMLILGFILTVCLHNVYANYGCFGAYENDKNNIEANLNDGSTNKKSSAEECQRSCFDDAACNYWVWSSKHGPGGCWFKSGVNYQSDGNGGWVAGAQNACSPNGCYGAYEYDKNNIDTDLIDGMTNKKSSAEECQHSCFDDAACNYWVWSPKHGPGGCWFKSGGNYKSEGIGYWVAGARNACPPKVAGGWTVWRNTSSCNENCGVGRFQQNRSCTNPPPQYGGANCTGPTSQEVPCNQHDCPGCSGAYEYDKNNIGKDLIDGMTNKKSSAKECQQSCFDDSACNYWVWSPKHGPGGCWFKSGGNYKSEGIGYWVAGARNACPPKDASSSNLSSASVGGQGASIQLPASSVAPMPSEVVPTASYTAVASSSAVPLKETNPKVESSKLVPTPSAAGPSASMYLQVSSPVAPMSSQVILATSYAAIVSSSAVSINETNPKGNSVESTAQPTTQPEVIPECSAKELPAMIDGDQEISLSDVTSTNHKIAVIGTIVAGPEGCGQLMFASADGWLDLAGNTADKAFVMPPSAKFKYVRNSTMKCTAQCHGAVVIRYTAVSATENSDYSRIDTSQASKTCDVHMLLQPGVEFCPTCKSKAVLSQTVVEDTKKTCFKIGQYAEVQTNNVEAFYQALEAKYSSGIKQLYSASLDVSKLTKHVKITQNVATIGKWVQAGSASAVSSDLNINDLIDMSKFICLKPQADQHGSQTMEYACAVKNGEAMFVSSESSEFTVNVTMVNDRPVIDPAKQNLQLKFLENVYVDNQNTGEKVGDLMSISSYSPEDISPLGIAISAVKTSSDGTFGKNYGKFQYKALASDQTWSDMTTSFQADEYFLLKADAYIRFKMDDENTYWTKGEGNKFTYFLYRAWDMSDEKNNGASTMKNSTAISGDFGTFVQLRVGCNGAGTPGGATDKCGVCGGDDSKCAGCDGEPNSGAKYDPCGVCYGTVNATQMNATALDCLGLCNKAVTDECGACQLKEKLDQSLYKDCHGTCKGKAVLNKCGTCVGGATGKQANDSIDACGVCAGDGTSCQDCAGVANGKKTEDVCGKCLDLSDQTRDKCTALGNPEKTCAAVNDKVNIPVATVNAFDSAACKFGETVSVTTTKFGGSMLEVVVPSGMDSDAYNVSCDIAGESKLYAKKKIHAISYSDANIDSLSPAEDRIDNGKALQNVAVSGSKFPDTGHVSCVVKYGEKVIVLVGVYVSATEVTCKDLPKPMSSIEMVISLRFCDGGRGETTSTTKFIWSAELPGVQRANFTNCQAFVVEFNGAVEPAQKGVCALATFFQDVSKLSGAKCSWTRTSLEISLATASTLAAGDDLVLLNTAISAYRAVKTTRVSNTKTITINKPSKTEIPMITLEPSVDAKIGKCAKFKLSYSIAVRAGLTSKWSVTGTGDDVAKSEELKDKERVEVDWKINNKALTFQLEVTNCFGDTKTKSVKLTKEDIELPQVKITTAHIKSKVSEKVVLLSEASYGCAGVAPARLNYQWEFSPSFQTSEVVGLQKNKLQIPADTLEATKTYTATLTVSVHGQPAIATVRSAVIEVVSQPLACRIDGVQSVGSQEVATFLAAVVDADNSKETPTYTWSLSDSKGAVLDKDLVPLTFKSQASLELTMSNLNVKAGTDYTVSVEVRKGVREITSTHTFSVVAGSPPEVKIKSFAAGVKLNPSKTIVLEATILSTQNGKYIWKSVDYASLPSEQTSYFSNVKKMANVIILKNELVAQIYTFELIATQDDGVQSTSSVQFQVNGAPSQGALSLDKTSGIALSDEFTATVSGDGCIDDDGVEYIFGYTSGATSIEFSKQAENFKTIGDLPDGNATITLKCVDAYGAYSSAQSQPIILSKPTVDAAALGAQSTKIAERAAQGDAQSTASLSSGSAQTFLANAPSSSEEQDKQDDMKSTVTSNMLSQAAPEKGDTEALAQMVEPMSLVVGKNTDAKTKAKTSEAILSGKGGGVTTKRRRRAVELQGIDVTAVTADDDVKAIKKMLNLQFGMANVPAYDPAAMAQKRSLLSLLDVSVVGVCKSLMPGEAAVNIAATDGVAQAIQLDFSDRSATTRPLSCASCWGSMGMGASPRQPFTIRVTGVNKQACLTSVTTKYDYLSTSAPSVVSLSNIVRMRMWSSIEEITPSLAGNIDASVTLYSNDNTTKSYLCMQWDTGTASWNSTSVTTINPRGELDLDSYMYHVTCRTNQLGELRLVEGEAMAVPTTQPTTQPTTESATKGKHEQCMLRCQKCACNEKTKEACAYLIQEHGDILCDA